MMTETNEEKKIDNVESVKEVKNVEPVKKDNKPLFRRKAKPRKAPIKKNVKKTEPFNSKRELKKYSGDGSYDCENFISDIFEKIKASSYRKAKLDLLKQYSYLPALQTILIAGFDKTLENAVDTKLVVLDNQSRVRNDGHLYLKDEHVNLYMFFKGGMDEISSEEKLIMLNKWMNSLHPDETNLLFSIFEGEMDKDYRLSMPIIKEVYPNIVWGNRGPIKEESKKNNRKPVEKENNNDNLGMTTLNSYLGI